MTQETKQLTPEQIALEQARAQLEAARKRAEEAEQVRLAAVRAEIAEREAAAVRAEAEERQKFELQQEKIRQKREAERQERERIAREKAAEDMRLAQQQSALEESIRQRREQQALIDKLSQEAWQLEQQARQAEADAIRIKSQVNTVPDKPQSVTSESHPLGRVLFANREDGVQVNPPSYAENTPVAVPETPRTKRNVSAEDLAITTAAWRSAMGQNSPASGEIFELLEFYDSQAILSAIKSFTFEWLRTSALPQNQVEHVRMRLQNTST